MDLRIIMDYLLIEWKELGKEGFLDNENEWEDWKVGRRKNFLVWCIELVKYFIWINIELEWMVLCFLLVFFFELRLII